MTLEQIRDKLCKEAKDRKDLAYKQGYIDAVLDFYNEARKTGPVLLEVPDA